MTTPAAAVFHARRIRELSAASDWAGLVRHWIAHNHKPALAEAVAVARRLQGQQSRKGSLLQTFLEAVEGDPFNPRREHPIELINEREEGDRVTLFLLHLLPEFALCDFSHRFPVEQRKSMLARGIHAAEAALQVAARLRDEALIAFLQAALARGFSQARQWGPARHCYEEVLEIYRHLEEAHPNVFLPDVTMTLNNLGDLLRKMQLLEHARQCLEEALQIRRALEKNQPGAFLPNVAMTLRNLGNVLREMRSLEHARQCLVEALDHYCTLEKVQPKVFLPDVASTLNDLGLVLHDLGQMKAARQHHESALDHWRSLEQAQPGVFLPEVAMTLNNLGNVLRDLRQFELARQRLDEGLAHYRSMEQAQPGVFLPYVAASLTNLGNVLRDLRQPEQARQRYEQALEIRRGLAKNQPGVFLPKIVMTENNLANVLRDLRQLEAARQHYEQALLYCRSLEKDRPDRFVPNVAMILHNLGDLLHELGQLENAKQRLEEALLCYRSLENAQPGVFLPNVAVTLTNLGNILRDLKQFELARQHYEEALSYSREASALNPTASLFEQQRTWHRLALLFLSSEKREPGASAWPHFMHCFWRWLSHRWSAHNVKQDLRSDTRELRQPDRYRACDALRQALRCAEQYRGRYLTPDLRKRAQIETIHVYTLLIRTCIDIWDENRDLDALREAVQTAEASRARDLMEMLAEETLEPANTPAELAVEFRTLRKQLHEARLLLSIAERRSTMSNELSTEVLPTTDPPTKRRVQGRRDVDLLHSLERLPGPVECVAFLRQQVDQLEQKQEKQLGRIHQHDADFNPDLPVAPIDCATAQRLVPNDVPSAIVHFTITGDCGLAFVLTRDTVEVVPLPKLSGTNAFALAQQWYDAYYTGRDSFDEAIPSLLEPVSEFAVRPVMERLADRGIKRLILAPNQALHLFPLHACTVTGHMLDAWKAQSGKPDIDGPVYLSDVCDVVYTPSLSILDRCVRRERRFRRNLLLVENPTLDLPFSEVEGNQLWRRYPTCTARSGSRATKEWLLANAGQYHVINYTGHATFNPMEPLRSALVLADANDESKWLTLREIFCGLHLPNNWLTVINGCESGMLRPDQLDELIMLSAGFLYAGAACVLCTLWRVYDLSSALLVDRFHQEWLGERIDDPTDGRSIGGALREAQRWVRKDIKSGRQLQRDLVPKLLAGLRDKGVRRKCQEQAEFYARKYPDSPPFASPAHWAAFTAVGLAYPLQRATAE